MTHLTRYRRHRVHNRIAEEIGPEHAYPALRVFRRNRLPGHKTPLRRPPLRYRLVGSILFPGIVLGCLQPLLLFVQAQNAAASQEREGISSRSPSARDACAAAGGPDNTPVSAEEQSFDRSQNASHWIWKISCRDTQVSHSNVLTDITDNTIFAINAEDAADANTATGTDASISLVTYEQSIRLRNTAAAVAAARQILHHSGFAVGDLTLVRCAILPETNPYDRDWLLTFQAHTVGVDSFLHLSLEANEGRIRFYRRWDRRGHNPPVR